MYCILHANPKILSDRNQWKFKIQKENDDAKKFKVLVLKILLTIAYCMQTQKYCQIEISGNLKKENDDVKKFMVLVLKILSLIHLFRFLTNRLDEHGDDYKDAQIPVMWEVS